MRIELAERLAALAALLLTLAMLIPYTLSLEGWSLYIYWVVVAIVSYIIAWAASGVWSGGGQASA